MYVYSVCVSRRKDAIAMRKQQDYYSLEDHRIFEPEVERHQAARKAAKSHISKSTLPYTADVIPPAQHDNSLPGTLLTSCNLVP